MAGNDSNTVSLLHLNGTDGSPTITDNASGGTHTWTAQGNAQIDTAQSVFGGASGLFDGTGDYLSTPDSADFAFGSGDFTMDFRVRFASLAAGQYGFIAQGALLGSLGNNSFIFDTNSNLRLLYTTDGETYSAVSVSWTPSIDTWYHIACVRSSTNLYFFVNGTQQGTTQSISGTLYDSTRELVVAAARNDADTGYDIFLNGWIDELRISKGIARWTANFTLPTKEYDTLPEILSKNKAYIIL